ncbi:MAG: glycosyltransferase [Gammaproteobacteria bacterium]|nr:glycosyltransferase [Gammaproteobacteria bacterium]
MSALSDVSIEAVLLNHGELERRLVAARVPTLVLSESKLSSGRLMLRLARHFRTWRPDLLHTHRYKENVLGSIAALGQPGLKSVRTVHGGPEVTVHPLRLSKSLPQMADMLCARFLQQKVICVSKQLLDQYAHKIPNFKLAVVENGIDVDAVVRSAARDVALPGMDMPMKIAFLGRFVQVKRLDLIIEIAKELHAADPGRYAVYLIGDGPMKEQVEGLIRQYGLQDVVHLVRFVAEPAPYLAKMNVLLMTSDHEGLPMTVLEALCLGVRVVSRAVGAIPQVLGYGRYGDLITSQEPAAYIRAIEGIASAPTRVQEQAADAYAHVMENYSAARKALAYLEIYEQVVGGVRVRPTGA